MIHILKEGWMEQVMTPKKKRFATVLIILILALVVGGLIYLLWGGSFNGVRKAPTGTWAVEESFPGSPVSDFTVIVHNLKGATHFELHVKDVQIGERVPLDGSIRSVPLIFSKPEMMKVWFFESLGAAESIIRAGCHQSGALIFPGSNSNGNNGAGVNDEHGGSAPPSKDGNGPNAEPTRPGEEKTGEGLLDDLKNWFERAKERLLPGEKVKETEKEAHDRENHEPSFPVEGSPSENEQEYNSPGADLPAGKPAGRWSVEPDTPPTALFKVSVVNVEPKTCYELQASGIAVGNRVHLDESICSISLMFSEPSLLRVKFFADKDTTIVLAEAECTEEGALNFIE